ncbi:MAG: 7-cyano-7-deazaguanine synthase [Bdellovibrionales bacterium]|nr:7-cyano-7-deazaguanine synthase [Bdellovibrionales bacterium]
MSNRSPSTPLNASFGGKTLSVVLLSGGLDSAANLAFAAERDTVVLALHVDYGQRAAAPEWRASQALADYYGAKVERLALPWLGALGGSSLTDRSRDVPELRAAELDMLPKIQDTARAVWVPNRNGVLLNVAAAFAERFRAKRVIVGFNREEATTFPDNSQAYLDQATRAFTFSTANSVEVFCYTTAMDKTEICESLKKLERPFPHHLVWSCYHAGSEPCGRCESCGRHDRALRAAGIEVTG